MAFWAFSAQNVPAAEFRWAFFSHILKSWAAGPEKLNSSWVFKLKFGFLAPIELFLAQMKCLGSLFYCSRKLWFYSLNITTFCNTCCFKYKYKFRFIIKYNILFCVKAKVTKLVDWKKIGIVSHYLSFFCCFTKWSYTRHSERYESALFRFSDGSLSLDITWIFTKRFELKRKILTVFATQFGKHWINSRGNKYIQRNRIIKNNSIICWSKIRGVQPNLVPGHFLSKAEKKWNPVWTPYKYLWAAPVIL